jgi:cation diffusion facilitator family transporter
VAGIVGFIGNELVALYRIRVGERIGSAALVADGYHARTDGLTSLAVLVGAFGVWLGYPLADPLVGLGIAVMILFVLKGAAGQVFGRLLDAVEPNVLEQIEHIAGAVPGVQGVGEVRARWSGHAINADVHVVVDCDETVSFGHSVASRVEHDLIHGVRRMRMVTVHVDPCGHSGEDAHALLAHHRLPSTSSVSN